jgi:HEAT repeat protein
MAEESDISAELQAEAGQWLGRLLTGRGKDRLEAASALGRLGVWTRGSVRTRGSLRQPAEDRFPDAARIADVLARLQDEDRSVRGQVVLALGEWGGAEAATAISRLLQDDPDEEVKLSCITALRTLGGPAAVEALCLAIEQGTEAVRQSALEAIEELATGGRAEDDESPVPASPAPALPWRTRGSLRTRGAVRSLPGTKPPQTGDPLGAVHDTLQRLRTEDTASDYLRLRASAVLRNLSTGPF